jgi:YgiT-type zinc finger domain-containing protein
VVKTHRRYTKATLDGQEIILGNREKELLELLKQHQGKGELSAEEIEQIIGGEVNPNNPGQYTRAMIIRLRDALKRNGVTWAHIQNRYGRGYSLVTYKGHICVLCGRPGARRGTTIFTAGRNGVEVEIRGVPAFLCDQCGDAGVPGPLVVELSDTIERIISSIERHVGAETGEPAPTA